MQNNSRPTAWRFKPSPRLTRLQKNWMMRPGALTTGLRQLGTVQLRVIKEQCITLNSDEAGCLNLGLHRCAWVREVVMSIDKVDCIAARSITPLNASSAVWQGIRKLKARPLADILYTDRTIQRSRFEVARIAFPAPLFRLGKKISESHLRPGLCARRSVFWKHQTPLMVSECFLPAFWQIIQKRSKRNITLLASSDPD